MKNINVFTPANISETLELLKEDNTRILAGGTDIILKRDKLLRDELVLIDISRMERLNFIKRDQGCIEIGTMATFSQLAENELINKYVPALALAGAQLGSVQIRNRATIGGNIANASPAADALPVLIAHRARVKLVGSSGSMEYRAIEDVIKEIDGQTFIISITLPVAEPDIHFSYFNKIGSRKSVTIARINLGSLIKYNPKNKQIKEARIVLGALGRAPFRANRAEEVITACKLTTAIEERFLDKLTKTVDRAIPGRYSQPYKRNAIRGLGDNLITAFKGGLNNE